VAIGGAHEYFNVDPDLAVFAKGCANGMPISVYAGKAKLIDSAKEICISSTYGGETLSLAAMKAAIAFYKKNDVIAHLWRTGTILWGGVNALFRKYNINATVKGFPVCPQFIFEDNTGKLADAFFKNCYLNGVSLYGVSYVNFSHKEKDVTETLERIEKVMKIIASDQ